MDNKIQLFKSGIHNIVDPKLIPIDASQDSENFITKNGKIVLAGGQIEVGAEGVVGNVTGQHFGYLADSSTIHYRKIGAKLQYLNGTTWTDVLTGLTADAEYSFANYSSLAGAFTFIGGVDGLWKIVNANPTSPVDVYDKDINKKGRIMIDKGRTFLWDVEGGKSTLFLSHIDLQSALGTNAPYTAVSGESIGASGSLTYSGTLAFKAGGSRRTCFAIEISATTASGTEKFTDDKVGGLSSPEGGTGTINYATGAYSITFSEVTTGAVTGGYIYEDSAVNGVMDFTYSGVRQAGEGNLIVQGEGGDQILNVLIGPDGVYYSMKEKSVYRLELESTDLAGTNRVYRKDIGIPNWKACISTSGGIFYLNTANPSKPKMQILRRNLTGDSIEPVDLMSHFRFEDYNFDKAYFQNYDRFVAIACKKTDKDKNETILLCDIGLQSVDVIKYNADTLATDIGKLYIGSSITQSVYSILDGFDDLGLPVEGYWISKKDTYGSDRLKKFRRLRIEGRIGKDQYFEVYEQYDNVGFELVGTIRGDGDYVDSTNAQTIGVNEIGQEQIGGADNTVVYPFYAQLKLKTPKFRTRTFKIVPKGIGYLEITGITDWDILTFEDRMPTNYRTKQNVSLDGTLTNQ